MADVQHGGAVVGDFKVGYAQVNINPPLGIGIEGYYVPRFAKGFLDDLEIGALALSCGEKQILLISADHIGFGNLFDRYRAAIAVATGIEKESIFLTCTHTHTGPFVVPGFGFEAPEEPIHRYADFVESRLQDVATMALADLQNARMGHIVGYAPERVAYIRRYKMKDGSTWTCPPIEDPNIDHPLGELDQRVNVVRFDQENGQSIVLYNYGLHVDTIGGELISADWPGWTRRTVEKALDGVKCIYFPGCQGDVGSTNVHPAGGDMNDTEISFDNEMKSPGMARFVGRALAGTILQVFDKVAYVDVDKIGILHKMVKVGANLPKPEELPLAKKYKVLHDGGRDEDIPYTAMELTTVVAEAIRMCELENGPDHFLLEETGVRIGCVAMIGLPGEPFTDIGVQIKNTPGWDMIMPCCITNGYVGYFPTKEAFDEGGYESRSSSFQSNVAQLLVDGGKALLEELSK